MTAHDDVPDGRRLTPRRLTYATCWILLLLAVALVPMPVFQVAPGRAIEVADLVELSGHESTDIDGSAALLAVLLHRPSIAEWVRAKLDPDVDLVAVEQVVPTGQRDRDYFEDQSSLFTDTFTIASAVALRAAGINVAVESSPQIVAVLPDGPADGALRPGDLVRSLNGVDVTTADELVAQARQLSDGDEVRLVVDRDGESVEVTMVAGQADRMPRPGLGVTVDTAPREVVLPFDVHLAADTTIGGPSAGLLFAVTVYDLVAEENLLAGRRVTGTGTVDIDGRIGRIGSLRQKVATAIDGGYELFLAPRSQADEAREAADGRILVIGVDTFADALAALRQAPLLG